MARYSAALILLALCVMTGCAAPTADLVLVPATDTSLSLTSVEHGKLQLRLKNQGEVPTQHSPVVVEFYLRNYTATSPPMDGGTLTAGQTSKVLEFEVPEDCLFSGCEYQVKIDPEKKSSDSKRSNNTIFGKFVTDSVKMTNPLRKTETVKQMEPVKQ